MNVVTRLDQAKDITPVNERITITASSFTVKDPATLPRRPWVYGRRLLRGTLSVIVSPGAVGKTALTVGDALALATGRRLLGKDVWDGPKRVWIWNLEDSLDELEKLVHAALLHWRITEADLGGRLFVDSGLTGGGLCIAEETKDGAHILDPVVDALVAELKTRKIDVFMVDPFVSSHCVSENDNAAIDMVAKRWAKVAVEANCAVVLVHHTRKLNGSEVSTEGSRGAVSLTNAARSVLALNRMTDAEGQGWGIEGEDRRRYFRAYDDKNNRTPPASACDWYYLSSVDLGNGEGGLPGDSIQVVLPWSPPDAFTGVTTEHLRRVQELIGGDGDWRENVQAGSWAGEAVADVLGLDVSDRKSADCNRVKTMLKTWISEGVLVVETERDAKQGRDVKYIRVGRQVEP
jgi:hypothetical protein